MVDCRLKRNRNLASCKRRNPRGKLKYWKKKGYKYQSQVKDESVFIDSTQHSGWSVIKEDKTTGDKELLEIGLTKKQAEKKLKSYMRKHDKC